MIIPDSLLWLRGHASGARWLDELPDRLRTLCEKWSLAPDWDGAAGNVSLVVPVTRNGQRHMLKVQWPHAECALEADALRVWNGDGAINILAHDGAAHALLLEHCCPGTHLSDAGHPDPIGVVIDLLPRLWKPVGQPFRTLRDEAAAWASSLYRDWEDAGKPCREYLVDAAHGYLSDLKDTQGDAVLLHQDLHGHNIIAAERRPWLAIDPKPLRGEREFSVAPIVRSMEFGHSRANTMYRLDRLTAELPLDRQRALGWTIAQTMAWSFNSSHRDCHYQTIEWLMDAASS